MPELVNDYNMHIGGADLSDEDLSNVDRTLYQRNGDLLKLDRQRFMVKVVKGLIGGFRKQRNRPGSKIKDVPNGLLNPEKHFKQTKFEKAKKKNCVVCRKLQDNIRVRTSYIFGECNVALCIGECLEKYHKKKVL